MSRLKRVFGYMQSSLYGELFFGVCILVLLLNDHFLKERYHNYFTGKLSDLVGPFILYRLLRGVGNYGLSPRVAATSTAVFAVVIKLSQDAADLVSSYTCGLFLDSCTIVADPTDLLAYIPFLVFAVFVVRFLPDKQNDTSSV